MPDPVEQAQGETSDKIKSATHCAYKIVNGMVTLAERCEGGKKCPPYPPKNGDEELGAEAPVEGPVLIEFGGDRDARLLIYPRSRRPHIPAFLEFSYIRDDGTVERQTLNLDRHRPSYPGKPYGEPGHHDGGFPYRALVTDRRPPRKDEKADAALRGAEIWVWLVCV